MYDKTHYNKKTNKQTKKEAVLLLFDQGNYSLFVKSKYELEL